MKFKNIYDEMKCTADTKHKPPGTLKEYSTYLSKFSEREVDPETELEIPGMHAKDKYMYNTIISLFYCVISEFCI